MTITCSLIKVQSVDTLRGRITGTTELIVVNGTASFIDLVFEGTPGTNGAEFTISSSAINAAQVRIGKGQDSNATPNNELVQANFRLCQSGEIIEEDK